MSDNEKETQVAEETQNTQASAEERNDDRRSRRNKGEGKRGERRNRREENRGEELLDRVVTINRVSKTIKVVVLLALQHLLLLVTVRALLVLVMASLVKFQQLSLRVSSTQRSICSLFHAFVVPSLIQCSVTMLLVLCCFVQLLQVLV